MRRNNRGFSLMETVVALGVFALIITSLYSLFDLGIKVVNDDKAKIGARVLAEQKMEIIRNLPYDDVGTDGGIPSGSLLQTEIITANSINYTVTTDIHYVDDDYDDLAPTDTVNVDYKKARVQVSWDTKLSAEPITLVTDIVPNDVESLVGGGTLYLEVLDSTPSPISGATVRIINNEVSPAVDITSSTNSEGLYVLPGALASTQNYQVLISKSGYSSSQTYSVDPVSNPNPNPANLSVGDGEVTNKLFIIDLLADLNIRTQLTTGEPLSGFVFTLNGNDIIGTDGEGADIYEYEESQTTDESGLVALTNLDPDNYQITFDQVVTGYDLAGYTPDFPYNLAPSSTGEINLFLTPHSENTLLLTVEDAEGARQDAVSVHLYDGLAYDNTQITDSYGQTFFTPLTSGIYYLDLSKSGYESINLELNVNGQTIQNASLATL